MKDVLAKIGWEELVKWRARELLSHYREIKHQYKYHNIIHQSLKLAKYRRNRALVRAVGRQFADYIQVEFGFTCNTEVVHLPFWYNDYSVPYKVRVFKKREFTVDLFIGDDIHSPIVPQTNYKDYTITLLKFGDMNKRRMVAGYLADTDTVYISELWQEK